MTPLLDVQHLTVVFEGARSRVTAVSDVSFQIAAGETLGLVGESGSGKSVTAFSILRLLQPPGRITGGQIMFEGRDLLALPEREMRQVRGARISLIFQEPMTALNPVMRVGDQIAEALTVHGQATTREARERAVALLEAVHIADAGAPRARLPPSTLRRHAAARDDRHRARLSSGARHRRRTDDGARRHDPGAGARSAARAAGPVQPGAAPHHPRLRRHRRDGRPRRRHVPRRHRRAGSGAPDPPDARARVHARPAGRGAGPRRTSRLYTRPTADLQVRRSPDGTASRGPSPRQAFRPQAGTLARAVGRQGGGRRELLGGRGRDVRTRRRVGQRQEHDGPVHPAAGGTDVGRRVLSRRERPAVLARPHAAGPARHADRVSGPVLVAESADEGGRHRRGAADHPQARRKDGTARSRRGAVHPRRASIPATSRGIRTSSAAASGSGSASRAPWR